MNGNIGMRALSALFAVLLVSAGVVPAMACKPLEPGTCTDYSFTGSKGIADDSNIVVSSDELTGDAKNAAIAQALSETAVQRLRDGLLRDGFSLSTEQIQAIKGVTTNESMTVTTTLVTMPFIKEASDEKAFLVFASNELGSEARAVVAHDGMISYLRYDPAVVGLTEDDDGLVCDFCLYAFSRICGFIADTGCGVGCFNLCIKPTHPLIIVGCAGACALACDYFVAHGACNWGAQQACEGAGLC